MDKYIKLSDISGKTEALLVLAKRLQESSETASQFWQGYADGKVYECKDFVNLIKSIDAISIVRCKECIHCKMMPDIMGNMYPACVQEVKGELRVSRWVCEDGYCDWGKRDNVKV